MSLSAAASRLAARLSSDYVAGAFRTLVNGVMRYISDLNDVATVSGEVAINAAAAQAGASQAGAWIQEMRGVITRLSSTQFTVAGIISGQATDLTPYYQVNRALSFIQTSAAKGYVAASSYSSSTGLTTVTIQGATLDTGLSQVWYGQDTSNAPLVSLSTDVTLGGATPSDTAIPSQKATNTFVTQKLANVKSTGSTIIEASIMGGL